jgi:hypothetical protein
MAAYVTAQRHPGLIDLRREDTFKKRLPDLPSLGRFLLGRRRCDQRSHARPVCPLGERRQLRRYGAPEDAPFVRVEVVGAR